MCIYLISQGSWWVLWWFCVSLLLYVDSLFSQCLPLTIKALSLCFSPPKLFIISTNDCKFFSHFLGKNYQCHTGLHEVYYKINWQGSTCMLLGLVDKKMKPILPKSRQDFLMQKLCGYGVIVKSTATQCLAPVIILSTIRSLVIVSFHGDYVFTCVSKLVSPCSWDVCICALNWVVASFQLLALLLWSHAKMTQFTNRAKIWVCLAWICSQCKQTSASVNRRWEQGLIRHGKWRKEEGGSLLSSAEKVLIWLSVIKPHI